MGGSSTPLSMALILLLRARYHLSYCRHEARVTCTYAAIINYSYSIIKVGGLSPHTYKSGGAIAPSAPPLPTPMSKPSTNMADNKAIKAHASCDHERTLYMLPYEQGMHVTV